jgi:hypothetical protein
MNHEVHVNSNNSADKVANFGVSVPQGAITNLISGRYSQALSIGFVIILDTSI